MLELRWSGRVLRFGWRLSTSGRLSTVVWADVSEALRRHGPRVLAG